LKKKPSLNNQFKIAFSIIIILITSCKVKKTNVIEIKLKNKSSNELIDLMKHSKINSKYIYSKGSVELTFQEEKNSLRSNIRIQKDSALWISLSKATIPVLTTIVSNDSVKFLNKLKKEYFQDNFASINEILNTEIDYELLQDFFLGEPIAFDADEDYIAKIDEDSYLISSEKSRKIEKLLKKGKIKDEPFLYRCWIEPTNYKCKRVVINLVSQNTELEVNYSQWESVDGFLFPMIASLKLSTPKDTILMNMDYSKFEILEYISMPYNIPSSYNQFQFGELGE
jgi:hypothetical protein